MNRGGEFAASPVAANAGSARPGHAPPSLKLGGQPAIGHEDVAAPRKQHPHPIRAGYPISASWAANGSPIKTPSFDALAADGLRYSNMHTTALCSPSRSCILMGRNHHSNAMAAITELASGYPGYNGVVPFQNGFLSNSASPRRTPSCRGTIPTCPTGRRCRQQPGDSLPG